MNFLGPAVSRFLCSKPKAFKKRSALESYITKLACSPVRPYSTPLFPFRRKQAIHANAFADRDTILQARRGAFKSFQPRRTYASSPIITRYEDLPHGYKDRIGLPFRAKPLSQDEATAIFGRGMDATTANRVLKIIHGRRVAGTLDDPSLGPMLAGHDDPIKTTALEWLRIMVPVDEKYSARQREQLLLQAGEAELLADGERLGMERPNPGDVVPERKIGGKEERINRESGLDAIRDALYKPNPGDVISEPKVGRRKSIYGESGLDTIREVYEQRFLEKERKKEEARKRQADKTHHKSGTLSAQSVKSRVELRGRGERPWLEYYKERAKVGPDEVPELSILQRLWPSALLVLCVVGASMVFSRVYIPPRREARLWPDIPPSAATVVSLIIANTIIFVAWRIPPAWRILNKYFIMVPGYPRVLSMLGGAFSHQSPSHLVSNMVVLWIIGTRLHEDVGRGNFLALYLSVAALSSFGSLAVFTIQGKFFSSTIGASGALYGITSAYLWIHMGEYFKFLGLPPDPFQGIPAGALLIAMVLSDVLGLAFLGVRFLPSFGGAIDYYVHLSGWAMGIAGGELLKKRVAERKRNELERKKSQTLEEKIKAWQK